jgi:hypothetical protein
VTFINRTWFVPATVPVELPVGLRHANSEYCWCDPFVEVIESGRETVVHRQVSWN